MSDSFFGGILDNIRTVGDDAKGFFDTTIGQAVAKGGAGGYSKGSGVSRLNSLADTYKNLQVGFYDSSNTGRSGDATQPIPAQDYSNLELEWLSRLHRFSGLSTGTEVKLGAK